MSVTVAEIRNFIGGELVPAANGRAFESFDPATGRPCALVPDSTAEDLERAVAAAERAFPAWRRTAPEERGARLAALADRLEARRAEFEHAESVDNGKPIHLARTVDIPRSIANLRSFAAAGLDALTQSFEKPHASSYTLRQPLGVVATISPWNLPLLLFTWKIAPALMAGNCVIAKPSEVTPMTAWMLSGCLNDAGFPPGVLNVLHGTGPGLGAAIPRHPKIAAISFTGGTATGLAIYQSAASQLKKVSLELGGKNPTIVFADADFGAAVHGALASAFTNQGQVCLCSERILVERPIYDRFKEALVERTRRIVVGDPLEEATRHGATVTREHLDRVLAAIERAKAEGGALLAGGGRVLVEGRCREGWFIEPTLFEGLSPACGTNQEEIFGPVAALIPFEDEDEAVAIANGTPYGLASSLWTGSAERARRVAAALDTGLVWINCWNVRDLDVPFGGMKRSGIGREGRQRALEFFTEEKTVTSLPAGGGV